VRQRERLLEYAASHIQHMQKALTEMNLQLHHVVADITGSTGLRIIRAIIAGERDPEVLACLRHYSCHSSAETIAKALTGSYRTEHLFALEQALALYDAYHEKASACDVRIEAVLKELSIHRGRDIGSVPPASRRRHRTDQANALAFDVRAALFALLGKDITRIDGLGPYLSLKLIAECGDDLSSWPSAKHFTSWLGLAPSNKVSGGKMLSSRTRRSGGRAAALLRLAAVTVGRTDTALGAFYRRLSSRIGKAKAVTATARKVAVLFYNAVRHGMEYVDPGASSYETRYRMRVVNNLHRRAKAFGFVLQPLEPKADAVVS
jgi:transposase